jgi:hypothetical protein
MNGRVLPFRAEQQRDSNTPRLLLRQKRSRVWSGRGLLLLVRSGRPDRGGKTLARVGEACAPPSSLRPSRKGILYRSGSARRDALRGGFDQADDVTGVRDHGAVIGRDLDGRRAHALGECALSVRRNGLVF